jgi:tetratricopeptide (TPR) repeat protein
MKIFSKIVQSALLITTPALIAYPPNELPRLVVQQVNPPPIQIPDLRTLSYDEVIDLLHKIESDDFEERCSVEELDQINRFVSLLAMEGVTDDEKPAMEYAVASLFRNDSIEYALLLDSGFEYSVKPAIYIESSPDFVLCKSWFKKQWDQTRSFIKEHKKAIIIGAIVVVTVAVVVVAAVAISSSAASAAAAAGGALASIDDSSSTIPGSSHSKNDHSTSPKEPYQNQSLTSSLQSQASAFKETIAQEQFAAAQESNGISIEDNGRIIGSLFAHKTVDNLTHNPFLASELKDFGFNSQYPTPGWLQTHIDSSKMMPHTSTDLAFSTDYATSYPGNFNDLNTSVYQVRGDFALNSQCYAQAVQDFGKAISLDPSNPILYLERGIANFELGNYEQSIADYNQFVEKKAEPFSVTDFSLGFAKGVPKGAYESGKGAISFLSEFINHPVQTSKQVVDSLSQLVTLVKNDEFGVIAEALSPELHQLVNQWDALPSETRGELAGYAVGKLGTDFLAPGAVAKVASKSVNSAKELVTVCKNLQIAQETLVLETVSGIGAPVKIAEIVEIGKKTAILGEEFGFTVQEINHLQKAGKLEGAINTRLDRLVSQSESEVLKAAISKDSHVKMVRDYLNKPAKEIQKGIKSYEKQIALHQEKIANPSKFIPDWDKLHPERQHALINKKWPAEIQCYTEQRNVLQSILNERIN